MRINALEIVVLTSLLLAASAKALMSDGGTLLAASHGVLLLCGYIAVRHYVGRLHARFAQMVFALCALLLATEVTIKFLTGLHLNWFVLSMLLQADASLHIGLSLPIAGAVALAIGVAMAWAHSKSEHYGVTINKHVLALAIISSAAVSQISYALAYYKGASTALETRRHMPFFWAPHPYRTNKVLGWVLAPREENPFAEAHLQGTSSPEDAKSFSPQERPKSLPAGAPNVLLIVADSLRSTDIEKSPSIAPTITGLSERAYVSLEHYSVSNCTHFSMYSMLTSALPTGFGDARREGLPRGLFPTLAAAGYKVSSAESARLDWYDLGSLVLGPETQRWTNDLTDSLESDAAVTQETLDMLRQWVGSTAPNLHLAYYTGMHFPYGASLTALGETAHERYLAGISTFDREVAKILSALNDLGLQDDTIVVVTSDHGEEFMPDGFVGHASRLSPEQTEVPLAILGASDAATRIKSQMDITPFLLGEIFKDNSFEPVTPVILANCGYDFPSGFAVIDKGLRHDFIFDDGFLVPAPGTSPKGASNAARLLLDAIQK